MMTKAVLKGAELKAALTLADNLGRLAEALYGRDPWPFGEGHLPPGEIGPPGAIGQPGKTSSDIVP